MDISAIVESEADIASMQDAVRDAADILGIDLTVTYTGINSVAGHTHATFLLDAVKTHRAIDGQHSGADATVLFTRRDIRIGGSDYTGIATIGPACSADASAIVELRNDGEDGAILAHELLHTVGVPHDLGAGWLMSEGVSRSTPRTMSPDSVLTFKAAVECMSPPPPTVEAPATGGGGAFDGWLLFTAVILAAYLRARR